MRCYTSLSQITIAFRDSVTGAETRELSRIEIDRRATGLREYAILGFIYQEYLRGQPTRRGLMFGLYARSVNLPTWSKAASIHLYDRGQAERFIAAVRQCWPLTSRGEIVLIAGPDAPGGWSFRLDTGEAHTPLHWPADVELTSLELLKLAWEKAPSPDQLIDITLSNELEALLRPERR